MKLSNELKGWITGGMGWSELKKTKENNQIEYEFSLRYIGASSRKQWSSKFGEYIVKSLLEMTGKNVRFPQKINGLLADLETEDAIYEVKTRNWTTNGTAGEKILGAPMKYIDYTLHTTKKLYIVLVGYQEFEAKSKFGLFENSKRKAKILELYKSWNIEFVCCSDLLHKAESKQDIQMHQSNENFIEHIREEDTETAALYYCKPNEKKDPVNVQCFIQPGHLQCCEKELQKEYPSYEWCIRKQEITTPNQPAFLETCIVALTHEVCDKGVSSVKKTETKRGNVNEYGKIQAREKKLYPARKDEFADLMSKTLIKLKDIAREFPKDKEAGGWSRKNKTDLIYWILKRRGISV
jgi:hypothetical protein